MWSGGSVCIIVGGVAYSDPISKVMIPFAEQYVAGSRETATTSSWRLTIHSPSGSFRATGASARNRAYSG